MDININPNIVNEMENMTDEELHTISLRRGGKFNRYTKEALAAQYILHERSGCFSSYAKKRLGMGEMRGVKLG